MEEARRFFVEHFKALEPEKEIDYASQFHKLERVRSKISLDELKRQVKLFKTIYVRANIDYNQPNNYEKFVQVMPQGLERALKRDRQFFEAKSLAEVVTLLTRLIRFDSSPGGNATPVHFVGGNRRKKNYRNQSDSRFKGKCKRYVSCFS